MSYLAAFPDYELVSDTRVAGMDNEIPPAMSDGSGAGSVTVNQRYGQIDLSTGTGATGDLALLKSANNIHVDAHDAIFVSATFATDIGAVDNAAFNVSIQRGGVDGDGVGHTIADPKTDDQHTLFAIDDAARTNKQTRELLPEGGLDDREQVTTTVVWDTNRSEVLHSYQGTRCATVSSGLPPAHDDLEVYCWLQTEDTAADRVARLKSFAFGHLSSNRASE